MTENWRPSRLHPDRIHLLADNGRGRCGAEVEPEQTRCAVCTLLAHDDDLTQKNG